MADLVLYSQKLQTKLECFCEICFAEMGFEFEHHGRHYDFLDVQKVYMQNGCFWCLMEDGRVIGTVAVRVIDAEKRISEMKRLYLLQEQQGKGYGKLMFDTAVAFARQQGFSSICADTRNDRSAARHLMEKCGFCEIPRYNDNERAELFYGLEL